jgi:hypothetical protein
MFPERQVARIALMCIKHGDKNFWPVERQVKSWTFDHWNLYATPNDIQISSRFLDETLHIQPRSQLGLAIRKS